MLIFQHSLPQMIPFFVFGLPTRYVSLSSSIFDGETLGSKDVSGKKLYRIHWMPLEQGRLRVQTIASHMWPCRATLSFHLQIARNCLKIYQDASPEKLTSKEIPKLSTDI